MPQKISASLQENLAYLQNNFAASDDFYTKPLQISGICCAVAMFTGVSSAERLCRLALDMLDRDPAVWQGGAGLCRYLLQQSRIPAEPTPAEDWQSAAAFLSNGMTLLFIEGFAGAVVLSTQDMPGRSVGTPLGEGNLRGAQDAFTEHLRSNLSLLRRQFRSGTLVAGSPYALVVPGFFAEHFECLDDYSSGAVFAGLIRLLKYLAFLLAVFAPGLYVMSVAFTPEIIPLQLLAKLAQGEQATPLPPMLEMLGVTLLLEIVREAGLRAPQSISHTVSLVGALILGETAVSAGILSVPILITAAAATIATLAVPSLYEQTILFRFAVIVLAGCFGVPGLAAAAVTVLAMACGSEPFGYDYLYPLMPPGPAAWRDGFVRSIWSRLARAGEVIGRDEA